MIIFVVGISKIGLKKKNTQEVVNSSMPSDRQFSSNLDFVGKVVVDK